MNGISYFVVGYKSTFGCYIPYAFDDSEDINGLTLLFMIYVLYESIIRWGFFGTDLILNFLNESCSTIKLDLAVTVIPLVMVESGLDNTFTYTIETAFL